MRHRMKGYGTFIKVLITFSIILTSSPMANAAGAITLTPSTQAPGDIVTVSGTGFGALDNVVLVFGKELRVENEPLYPVATSPTTWAYNWTRGPIKPGSMHVHLNSITYPGAQYDYFDDGSGKLLRDTDGALLCVVDYALGGFTRNSTGAGTQNDWFATFTFYEYNVTSFGQVTTNGSGAFSANFTVPEVSNGNYNVTVIASAGTFATINVNVSSVVPEGFSFEGMLLLSSMVVMVSILFFRKPSKIMRERM